MSVGLWFLKVLFLLRNAMLAWYMLSSCVCLSVCPFVHHKSEYYKDG